MHFSISALLQVLKFIITKETTPCEFTQNIKQYIGITYDLINSEYKKI